MDAYFFSCGDCRVVSLYQQWINLQDAAVGVDKPDHVGTFFSDNHDFWIFFSDKMTKTRPGQSFEFSLSNGGELRGGKRAKITVELQGGRKGSRGILDESRKTTDKKGLALGQGRGNGLRRMKGKGMLGHGGLAAAVITQNI